MGFWFSVSVYPLPSLSLSLSHPLSPLSRQEGLRGCRLVWLQSGCSAGRMPVAALMTLFSSGVQGVGVSGWTLPDGSRGQETMPATVCGKENNWAKTACANWKHTHLWQQNSKKKIARSCCQEGFYNLTMMMVKRKIWPYLGCGLFEFGNIIDESSEWGLDRGLRCTKWNSNMKSKPCRRQADKHQIHNMNFLSRTIKTKPGALKRALDCYFILHLTEDIFMLFDRVSCSSLQRSAGVHVETVSAPDQTCAPAPTDRSPHPVDPSQVVKQHLLISRAVNSPSSAWWIILYSVHRWGFIVCQDINMLMVWFILTGVYVEKNFWNAWLRPHPCLCIFRIKEL